MWNLWIPGAEGFPACGGLWRWSLAPLTRNPLVTGAWILEAWRLEGLVGLLAYWLAGWVAGWQALGMDVEG